MIRRPSPADTLAIQQLLDAAFEPSKYESRVRTFAANQIHQEWVFERDSKIVAHILFTQAFDGDQSIGWHLGPVAVHPEFQHQGIGSQFIREAINAEPVFPDPVFVLGDPHFYERFGFR
ncbi:MAG: N-acetyltransferase, partial [Verrucomicrobiota bacterium]